MTERKVAIPRFEVLRRGKLIKSISVHRSRLVIGSEDGADIRLKHPAIAPRHLEVVVVNGRYLEASNLAGDGRVLLGQRPMNRARLRDGDELDLGPVTLRLTYTHTDSRASLPAVPAVAEPPPTPSGATEPPAAEAAVPPPALPPAPPEDPDVEATDPVGTRPSEAPAAPSGPSGRYPSLGLSSSGARPHSGLGRPVVGGSRPGGRTAVGADGGVDVELHEGTLDPVPVAVIEPPGGRAQRVPLRVGSFVVGAGRCAFRLSYPGVAPAHMELMVMPDGAVYIKHLAGGGQRTLLNGAPVQFSRWSAGDRLQVGPVSIRLTTVPRVASPSDESPTVEEAGPVVPLPGPSLDDEVTETANTLRGLKYVPEKPDVEDSGLGADPFGGFRPAAPAEPAPRPPAAALVAAPPAAATPAPTPPRSVPVPPAAEGAPPARVVASPTPPVPTPSAAPPTPAVPTPGAAPPSPAPPSPEPPGATPPVPLVVARGARPKGKKRKLTTPSPLVTTHTVQVSLGISAEDTYAQLYTDDMLAYAPSPWKKAVPVLLFLILLAAVGALGYRLFGPRAPTAGAPTSGPVTATGVSGLDPEGEEVYDGTGRIVVGEPKARKRSGGSGGGSASGAASDPGDVDWDERRSRELASRPIGSYYDDIANAPVNEPTPEGRLDSEEIERRLYAKQKRFKACYEQLRETDASAEGVVWLSLTLDTTGRIRGVVIEPRSTLQSESLRTCLARRMSAITLPPAQGTAVTFSYKLEFRN